MNQPSIAKAEGDSSNASGAIVRWLNGRLPPSDRAGVLWATAWFFCLLFGYYHLRPLREAKGFANGSDDLPWLFLGSFLVMLIAVPIYGAVVNHGRGVSLVHRVYGFFVVNLLLFFFAMRIDDPAISVWVGRVYFVWLSVFNLFVISLMWSVFADVFRSGQAKQYFGWISAGGTLGGIAGSEVASWVSQWLDLSFIPIVAGALLLACQWCARRFGRAMSKAESVTAAVNESSGNVSLDDGSRANQLSVWAGVIAVFKSPYLIGIFAFLLAIQACGTTVYCQQADFIREAGLSETTRFTLLSRINTWVLGITLLVQLFGTAPVVRKFGLSRVLFFFPGLYVVGFLALWWAPSLSVVVVLVVVHRAAAYAVISPSIQVLYTVVDNRVLYRVKSFLDTAVVRGGDLLSAQVFGGLRGMGWTLPAVAIGFVPVAAITCAIGNWIGRQQQRLSVAMQAKPPGE